MLETYWRKTQWSSTVIGWADELSENLEHVSSEVEPVVYSTDRFFSSQYSRLQSTRWMKNITDVLYSIGKENHNFYTASVVCAVPNEWTRRRTSKKRNYTILLWLSLIDPSLNPDDWSSGHATLTTSYP